MIYVYSSPESTAAVKIQSCYRGYSIRKSVQHQLDGAITLQAAIRAFSAQQQLVSCALPHDLIEKGILIVREKNLRDLPKAISGRTPVYLPEEVSIVLKHSGLQCSDRLIKMNKAREVCKSLKLKHLVIPQASLCGEFLIERRLPINHQTMKEQMGLYYENQDRFTPAIQDVTHFLCRLPLSDLSGGSHPLFGGIIPPNSQYAIARYDNVPLYIEENHGYIGLIDLESIGTNQTDKDYLCCLKKVIGLFPYHFEEIINIGKQFCPSLENHRAELKKYQEEAITFFEKVYIAHRQFAVEQNIESTVLNKAITIDSKKIKSIKKTLLEKLTSLENESLLRDILKSKEEQFLDEHLENILSEVTSWIEHFLTEQIEMRGNTPPKDFFDLLDIRTVHTFSFELINKLASLLPLIDLSKQKKRKAAENLLYLVLDAAAEHKIIAFWQPLIGDRWTGFEQVVLC